MNTSILNNNDSHTMRWAIELAEQEYNSSLSQVMKAIRIIDGC